MGTETRRISLAGLEAIQLAFEKYEKEGGFHGAFLQLDGPRVRVRRRSDALKRAANLIWFAAFCEREPKP